MIGMEGRICTFMSWDGRISLIFRRYYSTRCTSIQFQQLASVFRRRKISKNETLDRDSDADAVR